MNASRSSPPRPALLSALLMIAALLGAALATVTSVAPAGAATRPAAHPTGRLTQISCKGASWCLATGSAAVSGQKARAIAEVWNGTSWRLVASPPGRAPGSLSCSGPSFCMAQGGPTGTETWNGTAWHELTSPPGGIGGVSCGSRKLCAVIFDHVVRTWNGSTWHLWRDQTNECGGPPGFPCGMSVVACGNATTCMAVGTETVSQEPIQDAVGAYWNGSDWNGTSPPADGNPAAYDVVSCAGTFCLGAGGAFSEVADGSIAAAGTWTAATKTWQDIAPDLGTLCGGFQTCGWTGSLSCGSGTNCMAFATRGGPLDWNGSAWISAPTVSAGTGTALQAASCGGATCVAVGSRPGTGGPQPVAELWNGTSWSVLPAPKLP